MEVDYAEASKGAVPKVSVLLTTYNHEFFIEQALDSVLHQITNFDFDVIVGEDCSTDQTRLKVKEYRNRYPDTVRLLMSAKNTGGAELFVRQLLAARGCYLVMLDGDDYWTSPNKLQKQVEFLDAHPECSGCFHGVTVVHEEGDRESWQQRFDGGDFLTLQELWRHNLIATCSAMFRRDAVRDAPEWLNEINLQDWALHIVCAEQGKTGYIDEIMAVRRVHGGGMWSQLNPKRQAEEAIVFYGRMDAILHYRRHETVREMIARACQALVADQGRLSDQGMGDAELRKYFQQARPPYCYPFLYPAIRRVQAAASRLRGGGLRMKSLLRRAKRRLARQSTGVISADPNPILVGERFSDLQPSGAATLMWVVRGTDRIEVRIDRPDGPLFCHAGPEGQKRTGTWVYDGMVFFLQDAVSGKALSKNNTLDVIRVRVGRPRNADAQE